MLSIRLVGWLLVHWLFPVLYSDNTGNKGPGMVYGHGLPELWYYGASSYVGWLVSIPFFPIPILVVCVCGCCSIAEASVCYCSIVGCCWCLLNPIRNVNWISRKFPIGKIVFCVVQQLQLLLSFFADGRWFFGLLVYFIILTLIEFRAIYPQTTWTAKQH